MYSLHYCKKNNLKKKNISIVYMLRTFSRNTIIKFRSQTQKRNIIKFIAPKKKIKNTKEIIKSSSLSSYTLPK